MTPADRRTEDSRAGNLVVGAALVLVATSVVLAVQHPLHQVSIAFAFGAFIAIGELVRITLPGNREAAPIGAAAALGYALLGRFGTEPTTHTVWDVVAVTASATLLGAIPHVAAGRSPRLDVLARRVLSVAFAAVLFRPFYDGGAGPFAHLDASHQNGRLALVMVGIVLVTDLFDAGVAALVRTERDRAPYLTSLRSELQVLFGLSSAIGATGVLVALAAQVMTFWALPVFGLPLLLTQFSFRRYAGIRQTYAQTIRSLSRVTEVAGYTETGHSRRVSELSLAVGRELGLSESDLVDLEYAALMHDLGQLSLTDPIPGGATVVVSAVEQSRIAALGAAVIRQTGVLDQVAVIVERQADPYRRPHELVDDSLPVASRIIKAANAYDDMVGDSQESARRLEALERLRLAMAYEFDPAVVSSLAGVVERVARFGF